MMVAQSMSCCWREFHRSMTLSEKKRHLTSRRHLLSTILAEWPLVLVFVSSVNILSKLFTDHPLYILKTSSKSAQLRLSSSVHKSSNSSLVWYGSCFKPGSIRVKRCWMRCSRYCLYCSTEYCGPSEDNSFSLCVIILYIELCRGNKWRFEVLHFLTTSPLVWRPVSAMALESFVTVTSTTALYSVNIKRTLYTKTFIMQWSVLFDLHGKNERQVIKMQRPSLSTHEQRRLRKARSAHCAVIMLSIINTSIKYSDGDIAVQAWSAGVLLPCITWTRRRHHCISSPIFVAHFRLCHWDARWRDAVKTRIAHVSIVDGNRVVA